jgi:TonB-dependent receptor
MRRHFKKTTLSVAAAQAVLLCSGGALGQTDAPTPADAASAPARAASAPARAASAPGRAASAPAAQQLQSVVVTGQRAALQSAQKIKQNSEDIVDGVVAEEAGKLPDKSITEVLQRVVGVTIDRNRSRGDPEHFSVEGSGIQVRGLSWGSSTLNGRESFSAGWPGRELSWGDVPPELMSAVIVHKNPPAELIEGGVSGQVDLRTALPFDYKDKKAVLSLSDNYNELGHKNSPGISGLYSRRWDAESGQWGALVDLSFNQTNSRNDTVQLDAFYPRTDIVNGQTVWAPKSASWRTNTSQTDRGGIYGALQWKKNDLESSLTYFHSAYKTFETENALFSGVEDAYKSKILNPVVGSNGVLQSGTYTYPSGGLGANNFAAGGLGFQADTGYSDRRSQTRELAWNLKWKLNDRWALQQDAQWVHATDTNEGGVVTLGTFVPSMDIDTTGSPVRIGFNQAARDFLADPGNYYMNFMMPSKSKAEGDLYAWRGDASLKFDDPVLRDLRFGVRLTDRKVTHIDASGSGWYSIATPWNVKQTSVPGQPASKTDGQGWQSLSNFGYFSDPRYAAIVPVTSYGFGNFFNGKVGTPPTLVVPTNDFVRGYPDNYQSLLAIKSLQCQDGNQAYGTTNDCSQAGADWKPLAYDGDPANTSRQREQTQAAYGSLRFGFDDWRYPTEGNVGVRLVRTRTVAHGYTVFKPTYDSNSPPEVPRFGPINSPVDAENTYTDVMPSLNLKMELTDKLQARLAFAQAMYRPGFGDLSEYITLNQNVTSSNGAVQNITYTGKDTGNVNLKPIRANNYDLSLEWNPRSGSSLTGAVFYKQVKDIILPAAYTRSYTDLAGNPQSFLITAPDNVAKGNVAGLEIAGMTYFDHLPVVENLLPEWAKGFGISANYTYLDSKQKLYHPFNQKYCPSSGSFNNSSLSLYGCDTNGLPFDSLPIQYLSSNAFNVAFLYDKGPLSARLAYSWRGRFLQGVNVNGTQGSDGTSADPARNGAHDVGWGLPTWQEATGQWDAGVDYRFTDNLSFSFAATNLTDIVVRQTQQQHTGAMGRAWFEPGRSYRLSLRYAY